MSHNPCLVYSRKDLPLLTISSVLNVGTLSNLHFKATFMMCSPLESVHSDGALTFLHMDIASRGQSAPIACGWFDEA